MVVLPPITGTHHARLTARPCRIMIAAIFGTLFLAAMGAAALANAGLQREAAYQRAEARI